MPRYSLHMLGPITYTYPNPFIFDFLAEALELIEYHLYEELDPHQDMICIYRMPDENGSGELVWRFMGIQFCDMLLFDEEDSPDHIPPMRQGKLTGHSETLVNELIDLHIPEISLENDDDDMMEEIIASITADSFERTITVENIYI